MQAPEMNIPAHADVGIASFAMDSLGGTPALLFGDKKVTSDVENVAANTTLAAYSVVGRVGNVAGGALAMATADGTVKPVGILAHSVLTGAGVTTTATVLKSGQFNADALVWDATYNTELKKKSAFEGTVASEISVGFNRFPNLVP